MTQRNANALGLCLALFRTATADGPYLFNPPLKAPAEHLQDAQIQALVMPWAKVLTHYGIDAGQWVDHPLIEAAVLTGPPLWLFGKALLRELAARHASAPVVVDSADPGRPE